MARTKATDFIVGIDNEGNPHVFPSIWAAAQYCVQTGIAKSKHMKAHGTAALHGVAANIHKSIIGKCELIYGHVWSPVPGSKGLDVEEINKTVKHIALIRRMRAIDLFAKSAETLEKALEILEQK